MALNQKVNSQDIKNTFYTYLFIFLLYERGKWTFI